MASKPHKPLFERLKDGLEEGIAHAKGELSLKTVELHDAPPESDACMLVTFRGPTETSQDEK